MEPSRGLGWAWTMLALIGIEVLALTEIVFFDHNRGLGGPRNPLVTVYFAIVVGSALAMLAGILLVRAGRYRAGGALQIVAALVHVPKVEGLIGVVGGVKALGYPAARAAEDDGQARSA